MAIRALVFIGAVLFFPRVHADDAHFWRVISPDHEQTFSYGSESDRTWALWGRDGHLALLLNFTNDPFVDRQNPRQYDNFRFDFPSIRLGSDGHTFYHHAAGGRLIPVAVKRSDFLGIDEVRLLPNANVIVSKPHGSVTVHLDIIDDPLAR